MKSSILCFTAALLASGNSFAQDPAFDAHQILALMMVNLQYTTAKELEDFCTNLDPAYSPRFAAKRVEWDRDIKTMYAMSSSIGIIRPPKKTPSGATAEPAPHPFKDTEKMAEMSRQIAERTRPDYEIPVQWKEMKTGKNIKEDVQTRMSGLDEAEQKRRCDFVLTRKGMPAIPPKELP